NFRWEWASGTPTTSPNGILLGSARLPAGQQCIGNDKGCRWFDNSTRTNPRPDGTFAWDTLAPNAFRVAPLRLKDVRNPGIQDMGVSVFKNTRVGARTTVQLRVEVFN